MEKESNKDTNLNNVINRQNLVNRDAQNKDASTNENASKDTLKNKELTETEQRVKDNFSGNGKQRGAITIKRGNSIVLDGVLVELDDGSIICESGGKDAGLEVNLRMNGAKDVNIKPKPLVR